MLIVIYSIDKIKIKIINQVQTLARDKQQGMYYIITIINKKSLIKNHLRLSSSQLVKYYTTNKRQSQRKIESEIIILQYEKNEKN